MGTHPSTGRATPSNKSSSHTPETALVCHTDFFRSTNTSRCTIQGMVLSLLGTLKPANVTTPPIPMIVYRDFPEGKFLQSSAFAVFVSPDCSRFLSTTCAHWPNDTSQSSHWKVIAWQLPSPPRRAHMLPSTRFPAILSHTSFSQPHVTALIQRTINLYLLQYIAVNRMTPNPAFK